jgi:AraC-like DNA-binding protein
MTLDLWSILIIIIAFQGIFLLSVLLFSKDKRQKRGNQFLIMIIVILIWFLAEFFTIRNKIEVNLNVFYGTRYGSWFLIGPLVYFYFKSITDISWKLKRRHYWHFLPFILFVVIIPLIAYKTLDNRQIDYGMLSSFDHREKVLTTIQWTYSVIFILQFVHLGFFLFKNVKLIKAYSKSLSDEYSSIDSKIAWLRNFNRALILLLLLATIFLYVLLVTDIYRRHLDYIYVLPIGLLFYFISFKFMRTDWQPTEPITKYASSSLSEEGIITIMKKLDEVIETDNVHLNPILRLGDLAKNIDISKHHLSQIINQKYELTFYDFINKHRVSEAKQLIMQSPDLTLLQVAFDSGFNNKTSFVNAFKKFEHITPSKFREKNLS